MSITHSIVSALNLKDPHLHFSEDCVSSQSIRGVDSLVFSGSLSYVPPSSCPLCGSSNPGSAIIKHGTKSSLITLPSVSRRPVISASKNNASFVNIAAILLRLRLPSFSLIVSFPITLVFLLPSTLR